MVATLGPQSKFFNFQAFKKHFELKSLKIPLFDSSRHFQQKYIESKILFTVKNFDCLPVFKTRYGFGSFRTHLYSLCLLQSDIFAKLGILLYDVTKTSITNFSKKNLHSEKHGFKISKVFQIFRYRVFLVQYNLRKFYVICGRISSSANQSDHILNTKILHGLQDNCNFRPEIE